MMSMGLTYPTDGREDQDSDGMMSCMLSVKNAWVLGIGAIWNIGVRNKLTRKRTDMFIIVVTSLDDVLVHSFR